METPKKVEYDSLEATKILSLYKKLVTALDRLDADANNDDSGSGEGGGGDTSSLVIKIRGLGCELEQLLENEDDKGKNADFDSASKIRVIEREIAVVMSTMRTCITKFRDRVR